MLDVYASCAMRQSVIIIIMTQAAFVRHVAGCLLARFTQRATLVWVALVYLLWSGCVLLRAHYMHSCRAFHD